MFVPLLDIIACVKLTVFLLQVSPVNVINWNFLFDGKLLTLNLPTTTIVAQPFNIIKWQVKFNPVA